MLQQRHAKIEAERDQLYSKFEASIYSVQQKTGVRNLLLEKKLSVLGGVLEHKEAQLAEVMAASNLDPATLSHLNTVSPLCSTSPSSFCPCPFCPDLFCPCSSCARSFCTYCTREKLFGSAGSTPGRTTLLLGLWVWSRDLTGYSAFVKERWCVELTTAADIHGMANYRASAA